MIQMIITDIQFIQIMRIFQNIISPFIPKLILHYFELFNYWGG